MLILLVSLTTHEQEVMLEFETYEFNLIGSGELEIVDVLLDFQNNKYNLVTVLEAGDYILHTNILIKNINHGKLKLP